MEALFFFAVLAFVAGMFLARYFHWLTKPWRVRIIRVNSSGYGRRSYNNTVDVILQKRLTWDNIDKNRIVIQNDIVVNSENFDIELDKAIAEAKKQANVLKTRAKGANR